MSSKKFLKIHTFMFLVKEIFLFGKNQEENESAKENTKYK
jgi:hypothetical protein